MHPKDRLQITAPPLVFHRALKLQETGMLKKHHRKSAQQRIVQGIAELGDGTRILHLPERGPEKIDNRFYRQTLWDYAGGKKRNKMLV